jgi:putative Mg2+ transporter-C (MgtC) family protein
LVRLFLAIGLAAVLGFEREWRRKPAGLRTHMIVSLGAATFTLLALDAFARINSSGAESARLDYLRSLQGLVGGIGFLGAGSILQQRGSIEGLTTAGSIWLMGAVGAACGGGQFVIAGAAVVAALIVLVLVGLVEHRLEHRSE